MRHFVLVVCFLSTIINGQLLAQAPSFSINADAPYEVYVSGSSTLHDWKATVGTVTDYSEMITAKLEAGAVIESFGFKAEVKSMDGGRGSTMNNKIYKALQAETHPQIIYQQQEPATMVAAEDGQFKLTSTGLLTIGGVEKEVSVEVMASLQDGKLTFQGAKPLKLSEFNIEPPSALFGQIETKDDITVHFSFTYDAK